MDVNSPILIARSFLSSHSFHSDHLQLNPYFTGSQFSKGSIEIAGISLREHSSFTKIWTAAPLASHNFSGATFFSPSSLPSNFFALGSHVQFHTPIPSAPRAIIAGDSSSSLPSPADFSLLFSANSSSASPAFFWLPIPPRGFSAAGHIVTASAQKPPLSSLRCLPDQLLRPCRPISLAKIQPFFSLQHSNSLNTFLLGHQFPLLCLNKSALIPTAMPNLTQIAALIQTYSPFFHLHPKDPFFPSSVSWFFHTGALLHSNTTPNNPSRIAPLGANLPAAGANDGAYWLDLPADAISHNIIKAGNVSSAQTYVHVKPALGGAATDIVYWLFYPFNGPASAELKFIDIALGRIGEHVGDWEHVTQRISNFDGGMKQMYFSQHSSGEWVDKGELEYAAGGTRPAAYATLHGHALYGKAGLVLKGEVEKGVGMRDETAEGGAVVDAAARAVLVSAEYLGVEEPAWLQYMREWGPKVSYDVEKELEKVAGVLPGKMKGWLRNLVGGLPKEVLGEEGPTGPKEKASWNGDES